LYKLECVDEVFRDRSSFEESSLVKVDEGANDRFKAVCEDFVKDFDTAVLEADGAVVSYG
jgi:hypothetical protein